MSANNVLEDKSCLFNIEAYKTGQILNKIKDIIENNVKKKTEGIIKKAIQIEWEDTTKVIIDNLLTIGEE